MMKLVMYSDQVIPENRKVDDVLLDLMAGQKGTIGYITSGPELDRRFYLEKKAYYDRLGLSLSVFLDTELPLEKAALTALFECDAIHLPGGDTRGFLKRMTACQLLAPIADWAKQGGILIGASAGAIMMTPTVALDAIFTDEDPLTVKDGTALELVPFEFFPHLGKSADYMPKLLSYSAKVSRPIAACHDGDGVIVEYGRIRGIGDIVWLKNGTATTAPSSIH